ncbi:MAG: fasciclin domain-containing protein [Ilumatobacteraceae bacterium]|jgi:LPXTG-motif cell wall-anchored protein
MKKLLIAAASAALALTALAPTASADETQTIAEIASGNPDFSTLVAALGAADLVGPFDACTDAKTTVFAPTNAAFAAALTKLGLTAEQLLADKELLTSVLTYHVVAGEVDAAKVVTLTKATTLNGADIKISVQGGSVFLNDTIKVTTTDIKACNGIIHVIDGVLVPPTKTMPETGSNTTTMALLGAGFLGAGSLLLVGARRRPARVSA